MSKNKSDKFSPADLDTPTDPSPEAVEKISAAVNPLIADAFALYLKPRTSIGTSAAPTSRLSSDARRAGRGHLRHHRRTAERIRKIGGTTMRSIGHVAKLKTIKDNVDETYVPLREMLRELMEDNKKTVVNMRKAHEVADKYK